MPAKNRVLFFVAPEVHILDLAGAVQTFHEADSYGQPYEIVYISCQSRLKTSSGLELAGLTPYRRIRLGPGDVLIIPGFDLRHLRRVMTRAFRDWLNKGAAAGAILCSVCTGAFVLGEAGLLENRECTTHWKYTGRLKEQYPGARVITGRLFVKSGNIYSSAGIATGIDLALFLLEERHGPEFAYRIAREMVVYIRRDGREDQESVFIQYRGHINDDIHRLQDWMTRHLSRKITIEQLAALACTSPRDLTRLFKTATGITIGQYLEKLRVDRAVHLLRENNKVGSVTRECGLLSTTQLRHLIKRHTGSLPSELRN